MAATNRWADGVDGVDWLGPGWNRGPATGGPGGKPCPLGGGTTGGLGAGSGGLIE